MRRGKKRGSGIHLYTQPENKLKAPADGTWLSFLIRAAVLALLAAAWWNSFLCVFPMHIERKLFYLFLLLFAVLATAWASASFRARLLCLGVCAVFILLFSWVGHSLVADAFHYLANAYLRVHNNQVKGFILMKESPISAWLLALWTAGLTIPLLLFWAYVLVRNRGKVQAVLLSLLPTLLAAWEGYFPTAGACWLLIFCAGTYLAVSGSVSGRAAVLSCAGAVACLMVLYLFSSVCAKPLEASKAAENGVYSKARKAVSQNVVQKLASMAEAAEGKKADQQRGRQKEKQKEEAEEQGKRQKAESDKREKQKEETKKQSASQKRQDAGKKDAPQPGGQGGSAQADASAAPGLNTVLGGGTEDLKAIAGFAPDTGVKLTVRLSKRPKSTYYYPEEYGGKYDGGSWGPEPLGNKVYPVYSQYPESLTHLIKLCRSQKVRTVEEAARFIQREFEENTVYAYNPGPTPKDQDFAEYFLFQNKKGFCVHFATTATLMYRILGFTARYAQGFAIPPSAFHEQPDGTYVAKVTGEMGHAWCETYQDGWTVREHTLPYHGEKEKAFSPASYNGREQLAAVPLMEKMLFGILAAVLLLIVAWCLFLLQAAARRRNRHKRCREYKKGRGILESYRYLCDIGSFLGVTIAEPSDSQTFEGLKVGITELSETEWDQIQKLVWESMYAEKVPSGEAHEKLYKMVERAAGTVGAKQSGFRKLKFKYIDCL